MTGAIKSEKGNYQLKTPVGSIGIRGTHYEVEIIDGEVFIAVWDGAVDITVEATAPGQQEQEVSLGEGEDYAYAKIDEGGEVTELLVPPENFNEGHSSDPQADDPPPPAQEQSQEEQQTQEEIAQVETPESSNADMEQEQQQEQQQQQQQEQETEEVVEVAEEEPEEEDTDFIVENEIETELALTPEEELANLVAARTGTYTYSNPRDVNFSQGSGSNFQAQMTMNFDTSTVETGHMSFDDAQGEWFATFNGIIYQHNIEVDVTFASHGNNRADGDINSIFTNDTNSILSSFELFELDNVNTRVKGKFTLD
jgi:glucan-binding YG repeat protein